MIDAGTLYLEQERLIRCKEAGESGDAHLRKRGDLFRNGFVLVTVDGKGQVP